MYAPILHNHILPKPLPLRLPSHSTPPFSRLLAIAPVRSATSNDSSTSNDDGSSATTQPPSPPPPQLSTPPEAGEIRFRRGPRKRRQQQRQQEAGEQLPRREKNLTPKKWEEMTIPEKALELYLGEKGVLFWLNKFAYASIFIIIGAWILFRFVGPALNLYQLDSPPLSPESIFKG